MKGSVPDEAPWSFGPALGAMELDANPPRLEKQVIPLTLGSFSGIFERFCGGARPSLPPASPSHPSRLPTPGLDDSSSDVTFHTPPDSDSGLSDIASKVADARGAKSERCFNAQDASKVIGSRLGSVYRTTNNETTALTASATVPRSTTIETIDSITPPGVDAAVIKTPVAEEDHLNPQTPTGPQNSGPNRIYTGLTYRFSTPSSNEHSPSPSPPPPGGWMPREGPPIPGPRESPAFTSLRFVPRSVYLKATPRPSNNTQSDRGKSKTPATSPVKATVQTTTPVPRANISPGAIRNFDLLSKLLQDFPEDADCITDLLPLSLASPDSTHNIHVFIDKSNILLGFRDILSKRRLTQIYDNYDGLIKSLFLILERRRSNVKKVYVGSTVSEEDQDSTMRAIDERFDMLALAHGYEKNILERVWKLVEINDSRLFFKDVRKMGWDAATAQSIARNEARKQANESNNKDPGTGSFADPYGTATPSSSSNVQLSQKRVLSSSSPNAQSSQKRLKLVEQGVDELLHLKMTLAILKSRPSTIVLATGDGNVAEYSEGFPAFVELALERGWNVELVGWKQQRSNKYREIKTKWGERFRTIDLDDYVEFML